MRLSNELLAHALSNRRLHLVLMPTEACNFRCTYCYEDFRLGRMREEVVRGVERLLDRRAPGLEHLELSWFGGEPLLAVDLVERVMEHARRLRAANPALAIASDATTNAWKLSRPVFERLLALGVTSWQISFDGPEEVHDAKRKLAGGGGTFARVWENVRALRDVDAEFDVRIRVHVDRDNAAHVPRFLERCREAFAGDARFRMFLRPLSRLGGPRDAELAVLDEDEDAVVDAARAQARASGLALLEPGLDGPGTMLCHAAWGNSFVVRADGRLAKCTVALAHAANDVGRLLEDGTLAIDAEKARPWLRGLASGDPLECLCPMMGLAEPVREAAAT